MYNESPGQVLARWRVEKYKREDREDREARARWLDQAQKNL